MRKVLLILLVAVNCAACIREVEEAGQPTEGMPATIRLEVTGGEQVDVETRMVSEDAINDLHVLVYDGKGELIGQQYRAGSNTVDVQTRSAENCTVYAIANTGNPELFKGYDIHKETYLKEITYSIAAWDGLTKGSSLLMTGSVGKINIKAGTQTLAGGITVKRIAAKITININVATHSNITITDYTIRNLPLTSYHICRPLSSEDKIEDTDVSPGEDAMNVTNNAHWTDSPQVTVNSTSTSTTFYMFENRRGVVKSITEQNNKSTANAPTRATYIDINGTVGNVKANWKVYLGSDNPNNFNIKRNCTYTYKITLNDAVTSDTRVNLDLSKVIDLSANGKANCYLASQTTTWYKFNATIRGNGAATSAEISYTGKSLPANDPISPVKAELVWEGSTSTMTPKAIIQVVIYKNGYIYFKTGHLEEGNAVIAAKNASGTILWSWHIWKTHFDLAGLNTSHTLIYKTNPRVMHDYLYRNDLQSRNLVMMDRDLGAASNTPSNTDEVIKTYGLLYQFGRKDPFPMAKKRERRKNPNIAETIDIFDKNGKLISTSALSSAPYAIMAPSTRNFNQSISFAIENPLTYIAFNSADPAQNWIYGATAGSDTNRAAYKLWGGEMNNESTSLRLDTKFTGKTIYDPCPAGWCLPPSDTWTNFTTMPAGTDYNTNVATYYNCPEEDKINYENEDNKGFYTAKVFGRRFYLSGTSGTTTFYPASGIRYGNIGNVGYGHYSWSSAPASSINTEANKEITKRTALQMCSYFMDAVCPMTPACGLSIRCVQEKSVK